ncbi:MAG: HlyD family efflux transporter periplasmic adaptor subunit [Gemmatimonadaceae bacterium]|nr:HlyD family efflux transporter periplasmic adaptor subunit [Gemmatimonadaceae bacterium]
MDIARPKQKNTKKYVAYGAGVVAVIVITVALSRLKPAAPTVDGGTLWTDTVRRGDMVLEVRGPGNLVPEHIRQVTAAATGRIDRLVVEPGERVDSNTVLIEMSNPDVEIAALSAQQAWAQARSQLIQMQSDLIGAQLTEENTIASLKTQYLTAANTARSTDSLAVRHLAAANDVAQNRQSVDELASRMKIEQQRLQIMRQQADSQIAAQRSQVQFLRTMAEAQENKRKGLMLRAGDTGVLQEDQTLELGQWVTEGQLVAKVVQPGKLKAVLRIPETQAKDVAVGQKAQVDTHNGVIPGHVARKDPTSQNGTVTVDVALDGALPAGAVPDLSVDGTITIEKLTNVLFTGRPGYGAGSGTVGLFKVTDGGSYASRVQVELGRSSVSTVEIKRGLAVGDTVILSDMSQWDAVDRVKCSPRCRVGQ